MFSHLLPASPVPSSHWARVYAMSSLSPSRQYIIFKSGEPASPFSPRASDPCLQSHKDIAYSMSLRYLDISWPQTKKPWLPVPSQTCCIFLNPVFQRVTLSCTWSSRSKAQGSPLTCRVGQNPSLVTFLPSRFCPHQPSLILGRIAPHLGNCSGSLRHPCHPYVSRLTPTHMSSHRCWRPFSKTFHPSHSCLKFVIDVLSESTSNCLASRATN